MILSHLFSIRPAKFSRPAKKLGRNSVPQPPLRLNSHTGPYFHQQQHMCVRIERILSKNQAAGVGLAAIFLCLLKPSPGAENNGKFSFHCSAGGGPGSAGCVCQVEPRCVFCHPSVPHLLGSYCSSELVSELSVVQVTHFCSCWRLYVISNSKSATAIRLCTSPGRQHKHKARTLALCVCLLMLWNAPAVLLVWPRRRSHCRTVVLQV